VISNIISVLQIFVRQRRIKRKEKLRMAGVYGEFLAHIEKEENGCCFFYKA
jgi:hypothetical protein